MMCKFAKTNSPAAVLRRAALAGGLALAALLGVPPPHAGAQSPLPSSPGVPTPYSWPNFHAGGPQVPQVSSADTALSGQYYALPDTYSFSNPLSWQLNGTPTGVVNNVATEIPSFSLGNFNPLAGPSGAAGTFFPNHFRDGSFYQIAGPFPFIFPNLNTSPSVLDDTDPNGTNVTPSAFLATGTPAWQSENATTDTATATYTTATNQEYLIHGLAAQNVTTGATIAAARWTISTGAFTYTLSGSAAATALPAGFYSIMVHLPNSPAAVTGTTANPFQFSQDAHYTVQLNPTQFTDPTATGFNKIADVRIQQGIVNDQVLAGPFLLQPTDVLVVTLDNSTLLSQTGGVTPVVAADSISLVQNTGGDVESAPAAVNVTEYPEIANAEYYGLASGTNSLAPPVTTPPLPDTNPRGNLTINTTPFTGTSNTPFDNNHAIRQMVYFGRLETVPETITDNSGTHAVRAPGTSALTGPVLTQQVGAIYCMDGFTGGIVWRYQTPGTYNNLGQATSGAGPVFASPAIARINVLAYPGTTTPYATKLVVVIADNRGFVYCLDAVGNRDGTSNSNAVYQSTLPTQSNYTPLTSGLSGLPIISPGVDPNGNPIYTNYSGFGSATDTTNPPHEGNTTAYWVYRPDPLRPKVVSGTKAGTVKTTFDPASDLPVPGAFGLASPTVYTAGYVATAVGTTGATDYPGAAGVASLGSNSIVYIGNSNGVLYALDGLGYAVTRVTPSTGAPYLDSGTLLAPTAGDRFNATLDVEDKLATTATTFLPTPRPLWWFSIRGAVNDAAETSTATIESAPAVFVSPTGAATGTNQNVNVTVYVTSAHEDSAVPSSGRLYAINGLVGPSGNGGRDNPVTNNDPAVATYQGPGSFDYNVNQRPQLSKTDTEHWSFPDAYGADTYVTGKSSNQKARLPLGNITGSPVVFANTKSPVNIGGKTYPTVNIYIAANSGPEVPFDATGNQTATVPDDNTTGRIWKVNLDGSAQWAYPTANDPNNAALQNTAEPSPPMGAFLHATPAMGYVQFPATIIEGNGGTYGHSDQHNANIVGQTVPMLYVATSGYDDALAGPGFYSLDIDTDLPNGGGNYPAPGITGDADSTREIEAIASPSGETFVSSPALVVNPSLTPLTVPANGGGNGGAVFVVGSSGTLVQFGATPITNNFADGTTQPYFPVDKQITGLGPISAPAIAAANVFDLSTTKTGFFALNNVQDWVYLGSSDGLCFGITPAGLNGGGFDPGTVGPPNGPGTGPELGSVSNQFQLHTYITTDPTKKAFVAADQADPTKPLAAYEWGENVNIRVTNVVPPLLPGATEATSYKVYDDQTGDYYDNGQAVKFSVTASSPTGGSGKTTSRTISPRVLQPFPGTLPGEGFVIGSDANIPYNGAAAGIVNGKLTTTATGGITPPSDNSSVWVAATTFPVREEEPGAQHRLIDVTQTADHYKFTAGSGTTPGGYTYAGPVVLQATLGQGTQFENPNDPGTLATVAAVPQPVFAVLNPLAVRGAGIPIGFSATTPKTAEAIGTFNVAGPGGDGVGPFRGLVSVAGVRPLLNLYDLQALTNGNRVYTLRAPPASVTGTISDTGAGRRRTRLRGYPQRNVRVTTSTGLVNHNSTGSNADPNALTATTLLGNVVQNLNNGLTPSAAAPYGQYMLDVADRSALGLAGLAIINLRMERNTLGWNDNTGLFGSTTGTTTTPANPTNGAGAAINPLPWDDTPVTGSNHSRDYPDIRSSALADILNNTDLTAGGGTPDGAEINTNIDARNVVVDPVKVQVSVPRYQPANLQFWDQSAQTPITPDSVTPSNDTFPMGYVNTVRVYVDSDGPNGQAVGHWVPGDAYRDVQLYSGVPVDMSTTIDTPTTDLGKLPQGFGLATTDTNFPSLGTFMPYPTMTQISGNGTYAGNPQNPGYVSFFKPLTISNRGNTNLLNVHLDQKVDTAGFTSALPLVGDTLDAATKLPAYDVGGALTGPRAALPTGTVALPFLVRSSLDSDLVAAFGRNPGLMANGSPYNSLGATFHKPRVGDSNPSILTVPDVPHDNDPTNAGTGYNLAPSGGVPPVATANGLVNINAANQTNQKATSIPYVALAIPQSTPVGTYTARLQLFEGVDPQGYKNIYSTTAANNGPYVPILPPQYGTQTINQATNTSPTFAPYPGAVTGDLYGDLVDTLIAANNVPSEPYSNGTVVKATVTEARLTDGAPRGDLPQVDARGAAPGATANTFLPTANFLPSAFRDPATGNVSLYWTSSRTAPYAPVGANLGFTQTNAANDRSQGYFTPTGTTWWDPITMPAFATGSVSSAISVVPTGNYAFVQNTAGGAGTPVTNSLLCYQVTPGTGALSTTGVQVTQNTSQAAFGVRGLVTNSTYTDAYPGATQTVPNNLWAFWYGGARGRSAIYYNSATANGGAPGAFGAPAVLPIPAGLVSVSDPAATELSAPDASGNAVPVIEVTYTGIAADGNADIYVSRYRPYFVRTAQGTATTQVGLALLPAPALTEQLQATDGSLYYQARDVAWANPYYVPATGGGYTVTRGIDVSLNGTALNLGSIRPTLDRATGTLVYTRLPAVTLAGQAVTVNAVYVDLARGRVRFSFSPQVPASVNLSVYATFTPQARRITTDSRADTAPIAFLDEAPKPNEADSAGAGLGTVNTNRYWFIWRKSGAPGTSTTPTLFYKTQRLTVDLQLRDANGQPIGIKLKNTGSATAPVYAPDVTVTANGVTLFSPTSATNLADVDWVRGRIYLPLTDGTNPLEGAVITAKGTRNDATASAFTVTDNAHWLDEPRYNQNASPTIAAGSPGTGSALTAAATGDAAIPIDTVANESNVTAFLDPFASATNPHKVWLFWNSTRNGTADIYYETISPLFSAAVGQ